MIKLKMVCNSCGSEDVGRDAFAEWDYEAQKWVLRGDPYDDQICFNEQCPTNGNSGSNIFDEVEVDVPDTQHDGVTGSHWAPADEAAEERAQNTGEDTRCRNCRGMFSEHINSRCPNQ